MTTKTDKTDKPKKTKATKATTAEGYNTRQAGKLWTWAELPSHLSDLRKRPGMLADAVRSFQRSKGLTADSRLGPKTLAAIRAAWSSAPLAPEAKPAPEPGDSDDAGDD